MDISSRSPPAVVVMPLEQRIPFLVADELSPYRIRHPELFGLLVI
jgi:hypothetical protein